MLDSALKTIHIEDHFLRYILTLANINQALYLVLDNTLWLNSIGIIHLNKKAKLLEYSNKFWLFSLLLNLARNLNEILAIIQGTEFINNQDPFNKYTFNEASGVYTSKPPHSQSFSRSAKKFLIKVLKIVCLLCLNKSYHPLVLDTLKNVFDIFLPLSGLKFIDLSPGMQGLCGLMSSLIGLIILWDTRLKLKN